jgi:hypothetical protein
VDYSKVSDADYIKDLETNSIDSKRQTALLQLASLDYLGDRWLIEGELQQFQSLAEDIRDDYKKLPQLSARYRPSGEPFHIDPILEAQYVALDITKAFTGVDGVSGATGTSGTSELLFEAILEAAKDGDTSTQVVEIPE